MSIDEAVAFFQSGNQLCLALRIKRQNFTVWVRKGYIPMSQQLRIEKLTRGALKADPEKDDL